ncbi:MAG: argininosuccinate lyase, partial [Lachnospiraceae bacterium]|nr:argininosuccinate lyase [Lachnospiraceae bacterium]
IIGRIILYAIENKKALDELTIEEYKGFSDSFDEDIYEAIDLKNCVDQRKTIGAPGKEAMKKAIEQEEAFLSDAKKIQETLVGRSE